MKVLHKDDMIDAVGLNECRLSLPAVRWEHNWAIQFPDWLVEMHAYFAHVDWMDMHHVPIRILRW